MPALEALPAGSRSGGRWGVQPISRAGEGMGLQVFPSSVWEFVQVIPASLAKPAMHGNVTVRVEALQNHRGASGDL